MAKNSGFYENFTHMCNGVCKTPCRVAQEIGLAKPTVTRWKNGSMPTDATAMKLADYFGVDWNVFRKHPDCSHKVSVRKIRIKRKGDSNDS